jgi:hypothetical protein
MCAMSIELRQWSNILSVITFETHLHMQRMSDNCELACQVHAGPKCTAPLIEDQWLVSPWRALQLSQVLTTMQQVTQTVSAWARIELLTSSACMLMLIAMLFSQCLPQSSMCILVVLGRWCRESFAAGTSHCCVQPSNHDAEIEVSSRCAQPHTHAMSTTSQAYTTWLSNAPCLIMCSWRSM